MSSLNKILKHIKPLAERMRPRVLDEFFGQEHILGPGRLLRRAIQADQLSSLIFYGPPGTGKTTLARIIANTTRGYFHSINAVLAGVKDIRESIAKAELLKTNEKRRFILFIDEVHRFNKAQQDALLPHVENGTLLLIGATTENPYFEVNKALISRSRIFQLKTLEDEDLFRLAHKAISDEERGYGRIHTDIEPLALRHIVGVANGDARAVLNALELAVETTHPDDNGVVKITLDVAEESIQRRAVLYDKDGDAHYDAISAFIKSVRGSDPDAALYWMAKMIYAGEDPRFIFRRMLILASEDIGLANPDALTQVVNASRAFDYVGLPEGRFHLAQACLYLATSPKSNSSLGFFDALKQIENEKTGEVPNHLKDASRDGEDLGHGKGYIYPHAFKDHWVAQQYLPAEIQGKAFYHPSTQGYEKEVCELVQNHRELIFSSQLENNSQLDDSSGLQETLQKSDYWLSRSLDTISELHRSIRQDFFAFMAVQPDMLVMDLSGETGFLTWEACRRCRNGGTWSITKKADQYKKLADWTNQFDFFSRPKIILQDLQNWNDSLICDNEQSLKFDRIFAYNIFSPGGQFSPKVLAAIMRKNLSSHGRFFEVNGRPDKGTPIYRHMVQILEEKMDTGKWGLIAANIKNIVSIYMEKNKTSNYISFIEELEGEGVTIRSSKQKDYAVTRIFKPGQVRAWFIGNSKPSFFNELEKGLESNQWEKLSALMMEKLPKRQLSWNQTYDYYELGLK